MTAIILMTRLNSSSDVVNRPDTLFFWFGTNLPIDGHFEFSNGLWSFLTLYRRYLSTEEPTIDLLLK